MKNPLKRKKEPESNRVTTETLEEHREAVLSNGRKFKYPIQYAKHKLVINTIMIGVVTVALLALVGWLQLYRFQSMNDILYRFTRVIPVPVAQVDGTNVKYSDYLMIYKSSMTALENQQGALTNSEDDELVKEQYKRQSLDSAVEFTYALRLAEEFEVEVTREQILEAEKEHRTVDGVERSEESFAKIIRTNFGLSVAEYERLLLLSLTRREVSAAVDETAKKTADEIASALLASEGNFGAITGSFEGVIYEETGGLIDEMNLDGGRSAVARGLEINEWSGPFLSKNGDGWYFVKLIGKGTGQVNYVSIRVPFEEFNNRIAELREGDGIKEYITLKEVEE